MNIDRFLSGTRLPPQHPDRPHACLVYAVYLHGARLSNEATISQMEESFLERAILSLQDAISEISPNTVRVLVTFEACNLTLNNRHEAQAVMNARQKLEAIQAEILIAMHFYSLGYVVEGRHHSAAASTLSTICGLHRIPKFESISGPRSPVGSSLKARVSLGLNLKRPRGATLPMDLAPPKDANEYTERVNLFWTVFACDRAWNSAMGSPSLFVDSPSSGSRIDTAFPTSEGKVQYDRTVQRFLEGEPGSLPIMNENVTGLRARAAAIFERANSISIRWHEGKTLSIYILLISTIV